MNRKAGNFVEICKYDRDCPLVLRLRIYYLVLQSSLTLFQRMSGTKPPNAHRGGQKKISANIVNYLMKQIHKNTSKKFIIKFDETNIQKY